jgi:DNA-directed RNA polymerase specialized sigma24 family protein
VRLILVSWLTPRVDKKQTKIKQMTAIQLWERGYSYEEIAEILNISLGEARSRVFQQRKMVAK